MNQALISRVFAFSIAGAISTCYAVDIANLPTLQDGDISISNDIGGEYDMQVTPNACSSKRLKVPFRQTVAVRCPGAASVTTFFVILDKDGKPRERRQVLEVNKHYSFGWDDELKLYGGRLIPVFRENGTMTR